MIDRIKLNQDPRVARLEALMFSIEMEGEEADTERRKTLMARSNRLDDYAVRHFGQLIFSE